MCVFFVYFGYCISVIVFQTCSTDLRPIGKHLFGDTDSADYKGPRWPREADVLIYESNISGESFCTVH
jgi:hypothetical protein